jgi:hypothetical protein
MTQHLREAGVLRLVGEDRIYPTVHAAVDDAPARQTDPPRRGSID